MIAATPPQTPKPPAFQPWKRNLSNALVALVLAVLVYYVSIPLGLSFEKLIWTEGVLAVIMAWQVNQAASRLFGQQLERKAIKKLTSVLGPENVRGNIPFPGHGDIDCAARINSQVFSIEIKAVQEAKRVTRGHIKQALKGSAYLQATPVIWLPNFKEAHFDRRAGVLICACDAKKLVRKLA